MTRSRTVYVSIETYASDRDLLVPSLLAQPAVEQQANDLWYGRPNSSTSSDRRKKRKKGQKARAPSGPVAARLSSLISHPPLVSSVLSWTGTVLTDRDFGKSCR